MWENLSLSEKNDLMKLYIKAGIKDLPSMISHYNTYAKGGPKKTYQQWASSMKEKYPWLEMNSANAGYDYERYFNENYDDALSRLTESEPRHFTDKYKLPSHITFSDESVYSTPRNKGGRWIGDDMFMPSPANVERYPWLYKAYRPMSEEDIYGHRFEDGGPEEELYSAGTLPEVAITASRIYDKDFEKTYKKYGKYAGISNKSQAYNRWLNDQGKLDVIKAKREEASKRALGVTAVGAALPFVTAGAIQAAPYIANAAGRVGMSKAGQFVKGALDATTPGTEVFSALPNAVKYGVLGANSVAGGVAANEFINNPTVETSANFVLSNPWTFNAVGNARQNLGLLTKTGISDIDALAVGTTRLAAKTPMGKRAAEVVMRMSEQPTRQFKPTLEALKNNWKYILYKGNSNFGPYQGYYNFTDEVIPTQNDVISSYLYKRPLDPRITKYLGTDPSLYGAHKDYLKKHYPSKLGKVQVYEMGDTPEYSQQYLQDAIDFNETMGITDEMATLKPNITVNTSGHIVYPTNINGEKFAVEQDLWKFMPDDYMKRWHNASLQKAISNKEFTNYFNKLGVNFIDAAGTPIIFKTKPQKPHISDMSNYFEDDGIIFEIMK